VGISWLLKGTPKAVPDSCDDLVVGRVRELGVALGDATVVVMETLALLLSAMEKLVDVAGLGVGTLEVPCEGISKLSLAVDPPLGEVLEPGTCRVDKAKWDAVDDEQIDGRPAVMVGEAVVLKPNARVSLSFVLHDGGRSTISSWWGCGENVDAEISRTSGVRRWAPTVLPSRPAFAVRPASGHHPSTRRGCTSGSVVGLDPANDERVHTFHAAQLPRWT
jgi:hypothetical protein